MHQPPQWTKQKTSESTHIAATTRCNTRTNGIMVVSTQLTNKIDITSLTLFLLLSLTILNANVGALKCSVSAQHCK
jgi:hypothetical protein